MKGTKKVRLFLQRWLSLKENVFVQIVMVQGVDQELNLRNVELVQGQEPKASDKGCS